MKINIESNIRNFVKILAFNYFTIRTISKIKTAKAKKSIIPFTAINAIAHIFFLDFLFLKIFKASTMTKIVEGKINKVKNKIIGERNTMAK